MVIVVFSFLFPGWLFPTSRFCPAPLFPAVVGFVELFVACPPVFALRSGCAAGVGFALAFCEGWLDYLGGAGASAVVLAAVVDWRETGTFSVGWEACLVGGGG